jgi:hypothetical protein
MNRKAPAATDFETDLLRLNALARRRRKQLARLEKCPNKNCECRLVWREFIEKNLAGQVVKIRRRIRAQSPTSSKPKRRRPR